MTKKHLCLLFIALLGVSACSSSNEKKNSTIGYKISDPFEEQNRMIMSFNQSVDKAVIYPVIDGYRAVAPKPVRHSIRNFLRNIGNPVVFLNQVLQGDITGAGDVLVRTAVNTTFGVGGLFDVAAAEGVEYEHEDFGQTLAVWGVENGPYMVLPFIGPSSLRDYGGYITDSFADPLRWYAFNTEREWPYTGRFVLGYMDLRDSLKDTQIELEESSFDYYAAVRSTYYQFREKVIHDGQIPEAEYTYEFPDYDDEFEE